LTDSPKYKIFSSELESRLNELFREDDPAPQPAKTEGVENNPLTELKQTVLSIDWEITPASLDSFQEQIRQLKKPYADNKLVLALLHILEHLGHYITASRSKVHPGTFNVLNSVFARLDDVLNTPGMAEGDKRKTLQEAVTAYQELRHKISQRREVKPSAKAHAAAAAAETPASAVVTPEMLSRAVLELKEFIRSEVGMLKEQLKLGPRRGQ